MNYHNITSDDMLNGSGLRAVLWVAGCNHQCKGCQNPITWDASGGILFDHEAKLELYDQVAKDYISGITFSGGDPLFPENRKQVYEIASEVKTMRPDKTIWLYTGYLWEEVKDIPLMDYIDVLVDGEYVEKLRDTSLHWCGSSNQRIIDVRESKKNMSVVLFKG